MCLSAQLASKTNQFRVAVPSNISIIEPWHYINTSKSLLCFLLTYPSNISITEPWHYIKTSKILLCVFVNIFYLTNHKDIIFLILAGAWTSSPTSFLFIYNIENLSRCSRVIRLYGTELWILNSSFNLPWVRKLYGIVICILNCFFNLPWAIQVWWYL
jgi:hypothetical protein